MHPISSAAVGVLAVALAACSGGLGEPPAHQPPAVSAHLVVMEYEAWFGPHAVTFQEAEAMPILQSKDMQRLGGGYDSADPHVIEQHLKWMQYMGIDAASIDLTNNVGCIFSTGPVSSKFCNPANKQFRYSNRIIRDNTGNLYPAWSKLGAPVKLLPLLGCQTKLDLRKGSDGKSGFQKEIEYFGRLTKRYPALSVVYFGHPLMLVYVGTPVDPTILNGAKAVLRDSGLDKEYTFRIVAGYLDSQPAFWGSQPPPRRPNRDRTPIRILERRRSLQTGVCALPDLQSDSGRRQCGKLDGLHRNGGATRVGMSQAEALPGRCHAVRTGRPQLQNARAFYLACSQAASDVPDRQSVQRVRKAGRRMGRSDERRHRTDSPAARMGMQRHRSRSPSGLAL